MEKPKNRFGAEAEAGKGWRIWDKQQKKWWGERYQSFPENLLLELNGDKRPEHLTQLIRQHHVNVSNISSRGLALFWKAFR